MKGFKIKKGLQLGCILPPYLLNLYADHIVQNTILDESKLALGFLEESSVISDKLTTPHR